MKSRAAWVMAASMGVAGIACGSNVTLEPTSAGGGGAVASSSTGDIGGGGIAGEGGVAPGPGGFGGSGGVAVGGGPGGEGGIGGSGGEGGSAPVCPGFGDPCTECMSTGCAQVYCDCSDEIHCFGFLECAGTCMGDTACFQNCAGVHEPGISKAFLVSDCAATVCDGSCTWGQALNPCQKCLHTECGPEMSACLGDPECVALVQCLQTCAPGDMACGQVCVNAHLMGLPEAQAVRDCRIANCTDSCP